ncbi:PAS domain-containing hybrid sensor histidine kinase/response regulator [Portibacter marinus]|uniref:PAS domain-containing hybrid sensor histidine kinase/response regulator n=1 Tax=Portibacter marinus TaxID=2898660 RepID=UPI001F3606F2|nr:PAS domain-containing hybrid sensor histidine kinase/response regulator [Portibacter marinus]
MNKTHIDHSTPKTSDDWLKLLRDAPCGYLLLSSRGDIVYANDTFLSWMQYERSEIEDQKKFQDFLPIGHRLFYETQHLMKLRLQGEVNEVNYSLRRKDGGLKETLINSKVVKGELDKVSQIQLIIMPFSERITYEKELLKAKKASEEAAHSKSNFLATMSHEIRTPIHAIINASKILDHFEPQGEQKELLDVIHSAGDHLLKLINSVLDLSKLEAKVMAPVSKSFNMSDLLEQLVKIYRPLAKINQVMLTSEIDPNLKTELVSDEVKINQILTNLIGNAIKFTKNGTITIFVKVQGETSDQIHLRIEIRDTGIGMSESEVQKVKDPFTQANSEIYSLYGGSGLGLSITNRLLEVLGSNLQIESTKGQGSTFWFELSVDKGHEITVCQNEHSKTFSGMDLSHLRILNVDDQPSNLLIIKHFCRMCNANFYGANSGEEALDYLQTEDFDLILMDINMPGMSGFDATQAIRTLDDPKKAQVPIIGFSAYESQDIIVKARQVGMNNVLSKPIAMSKLYEQISLLTSEINQVVQSVPQWTPFENLTDVPSLSSLKSFFDNDKEAISEYLTLAARDLDDIIEDLEEVLENNSIEIYKKATHKSTTILRFLEMNSIQSMIDEMKDLLYDSDDFHNELIKLIAVYQDTAHWIRHQLSD